MRDREEDKYSPTFKLANISMSGSNFYSISHSPPAQSQETLPKSAYNFMPELLRLTEPRPSPSRSPNSRTIPFSLLNRNLYQSKSILYKRALWHVVPDSAASLYFTPPSGHVFATSVYDRSTSMFPLLYVCVHKSPASSALRLQFSASSTSRLCALQTCRDESCPARSDAIDSARSSPNTNGIPTL